MGKRKLVDVATRNRFDINNFERFVCENYSDAVTIRFSGNKKIIEIFDSKTTECVDAYKLTPAGLADEEKVAKEKENTAKANTEAAKALEERKKAVSKILITSGFSFEGYTITKYSGYISGDDAVEVERGLSVFAGIGAANACEGLMASLVKIRRNALQELKEAAYDLGCNAVIGVDFDYITLDPQTANITGGTTYMPYVFGVTANGNAVIIEKNEI